MKTNSIINICIAALLCSWLFIPNRILAQNPKQIVRDGNKLYEQKKYSDAEINYRKAIAKKSEDPRASYNLGNALYKQKRYKEASVVFDSLTKISTLDEELQAKVNHNLGNSLLLNATSNDTIKPEAKQELIKQSIEAYKKSLRLNPKDEESRYNLSYAKQLLQKMNQSQQNKNNQNNKNNQQQQQQKQNQNQQNKNNQNKNQNQNQNNSNSDQKQDQNKQNQQAGAKPKMSKEDAEKILNALKNNEKKTLDKVNEQHLKKEDERLEKDW